MKFKLLTAACIAAISTAAFASNTATVNVSATVTTGAEITGMPTAINFGSVTPTTVRDGSVPESTTANVDVYDNNPATGLQIQTNCTSNNGGNGCYICNGGTCTVNNQRVLVQCQLTSCKASGSASATTFTVTPGATDANPFTPDTTIPAADSSESACSTASGGTQGQLVCSLQPTGVMNVSGAYTGTMVFTASDA